MQKERNPDILDLIMLELEGKPLRREGIAIESTLKGRWYFMIHEDDSSLRYWDTVGESVDWTNLNYHRSDFITKLHAAYEQFEKWVIAYEQENNLQP